MLFIMLYIYSIHYLRLYAIDIVCELHKHYFTISIYTSNILKIFSVPYYDLSFFLLVLLVINSSSKQLVIYFPLP